METVVKPKVLVTGGAGYVGSVFVPLLLENGYRVRVVDNLMYKHPSLWPYFIDNNFEFIKGDVRDEKTIKDALGGVDFIIHLAALVGEPACKKDPRLCYELNRDSVKLINRLRNKDQKIIFASTGSVYGKIEDEICIEDSPTNPVSDYAIAKLEAEKFLQETGEYMIYRFATAFGLAPRLRLDLMVNDFVYRALYHKVIIVYEAHFKRTFVHVRDMARSFIHAIENFDNMKNEIYNVGHESLNFSKKDIAEKIKDKTDYILHFADFGTDPDQRNYEVSYEKIRNKGFETVYGLDNGIDELIKGYSMLQIHNPFSNV